MRTRITGPARQVVRPVGEEPCVGAVTAEPGKVPRAVDIRDLLEAGDHGRNQYERERHVGGAVSQVPEPRQPRPGNGDHERGKADESHEPAARLMDEVDRPPAVRGDEGLGRAVVKKCFRNAEVEIAREDCSQCKHDAHDPCWSPRNSLRRKRLSLSRFLNHDQKLRLV